MEYGLIGEHLGHSFSKSIHERLADYTYELYPLSEAGFHRFMKEKAFKAVNVTIPYKIKAMAYLDHADDKVKQIGAVNTILQRDGKLYGTNTDYDGFRYMLKQHHISVYRKKVLVLGDGGAAQAVKAVLHDEGCAQIISVRRSRSDTTISYEEAKINHRDCEIIVNTTPCGMYPSNNQSPCDLRDFPNCEAYVDIIYNPLLTQACIQAKALGIIWVGGLEMLIAQAKYAVEFFCGRQLDDACIDTIYRQMLQEKHNLVLIGMPSCGKSTIGRLAAKQLNRTCVDLDEEIVKRSGRSIKEIITADGEATFRNLESEVCKDIAKEQGQLIACGGGIVTRGENMDALAQNGVIVYIKRDLRQLLVDEQRPLSTDKEAIAALYRKRKALYEGYGEIHIDNDADIRVAVERLIQAWQSYHRK